MELVRICGWCPDAKERTNEARARGLGVTHYICAPCAGRYWGKREPPWDLGDHADYLADIRNDLDREQEAFDDAR